MERHVRVKLGKPHLSPRNNQKHELRSANQFLGCPGSQSIYYFRCLVSGRRNRGMVLAKTRDQQSAPARCGKKDYYN